MKPVRNSVGQAFKDAGDATKLAMDETGISKASAMVADDATDAAAKTMGKEGEQYASLHLICLGSPRLPFSLTAST